MVGCTPLMRQPEISNGNTASWTMLPKILRDLTASELALVTRQRGRLGSRRMDIWFTSSVFDQCRVVAIHCVTGQKQWSFQTGGWILGDPAVDDQRLYVGSQDKHIYCLNKTTGEVLWKSATGSRIESGPAVNDSRVFIASCDGSLYCYAKETGVLIWKFAADRDGNRASAIYSAPIVTHDSLIFAAAEGHVYALVAETGVLRWKLQPSKTSHLYTTPATDGTRIFVKSRPQAQGVGENVIIAIGPSPDSN